MPHKKLLLDRQELFVWHLLKQAFAINDKKVMPLYKALIYLILLKHFLTYN
tara:strand:+ start:294 stop:446 length:153 start_codon:yes stop_codon:yes gene_type:complete